MIGLLSALLILIVWSNAQLYRLVPGSHVVGLREAFALERRLIEVRRLGGRVSVCASWSPKELDLLRIKKELPWDLLILNRKEAERVSGL